MNERVASWRRLLVASLALALVVQAGCMGPPGSTKEEEVANALKMRDETLEELYVREPGTKEVLANAPGYVVMKGGSLHLGLISLATCYMVIVDKSDPKPRHDNFFRFGLGPGIAAKSFHGVMIVHDRQTLLDWIDKPWMFGLLIEASFKFGSFGGSLADAYSFGDNGTVYYWTGNGFALEAALGIGRAWARRHQRLT